MPEEFEGIVRVRKWGSSYVICLPKELREFLAVVHRDMLAYRKVGRHVVLKRITPSELLPLGEGEKRRPPVEVET